MTLTLNLPPELEQYLLHEADQRGISLEALTLELLANSIGLKQQPIDLVNLLQRWIEAEDEGEQQETGQYLINALNEDRLSDRPLFPSELQGISW